MSGSDVGWVAGAAVTYVLIAGLAFEFWSARGGRSERDLLFAAILWPLDLASIAFVCVASVPFHAGRLLFRKVRRR